MPDFDDDQKGLDLSFFTAAYGLPPDASEEEIEAQAYEGLAEMLGISKDTPREEIDKLMHSLTGALFAGKPVSDFYAPHVRNARKALELPEGTSGDDAVKHIVGELAGFFKDFE